MFKNLNFGIDLDSRVASKDCFLDSSTATKNYTKNCTQNELEDDVALVDPTVKSTNS